MVGGGGIGLVYDERMCAHRNLDNPFHPERPARITSIFKALESAGIVDRCERVEARDATPAELASVHTPDHVANMCTVSNKKLGKSKRAELARRRSIYFNEGSSSSALLAAGSVVEMSLRVARGDLRAGAAVVRPPGHHAEADTAMGFCLFNNVAIAAHVLVHGNPDLGIQKVLVVDWDVHHGNGTQHMFWRDRQVLYFSVHRYDSGEFYPGGDDGNYDKVGEGSGAGFNINVPWPEGGFGDVDYLAVFNDILMPVAQEFVPDLVLVSGGFDSATGDPLGGCEVTPAGYSQMTRKLMDLANGRVVLALEGGYNLESISESYLACMKVLLGDQPEKIRRGPSDSNRARKKVPGDEHNLDTMSRNKHVLTYFLVKEVRRKLQHYWPILSTPDDAESFIHVMREIPGQEVEEVSAEVDSKLSNEEVSAEVDSKLSNEGGEVSRLVEAFNQSLSLEPESHEVTAGFPVDESLIEAKERNDEEKSGPSGAEAGLAGEAGPSSPLEVGSSHNGQSYTSCQAPVEATSQISDHLDAESHYVWYACYASNLLMARFMCYIEGGQVEGMGKVCLGSRNQAPPVASRWAMVPYHLFFGQSWTGTWGSGGVAFLDPVSHGGAPTTHVRLYKITLQQLQDLLVQENDGDPNSSQLLLEREKIDSLRDVSVSSHATLDILQESWYGTIKYLGDEDDLPILTITCSVENMQRFREGQFQVCPPSESYFTVIRKGLLEHENMSEEQARAYIASKSKGLPADADDEHT